MKFSEEISFVNEFLIELVDREIGNLSVFYDIQYVGSVMSNASS